MPTFVSSAELECPSTALRGFLGRPENLPKISNPELKLEIVSAPVEVTVGELIQFRIMAFGFRQRATHQYLEVTDLTIVESQTDGPMRAWTHAQRIDVLSETRCRLTDEVTFERPGGMLSFVLTEERIRESLEEGMALRYEALQELIAAGALT